MAGSSNICLHVILGPILKSLSPSEILKNQGSRKEASKWVEKEWGDKNRICYIAGRV